MEDKPFLIEYFLDDHVHPLPQKSACVVYDLVIEFNLQLFFEVDALEALLAGDDKAATIYFEGLAAFLPGNSQFLNVEPEPEQLLLECPSSNDLRLEGLHVDRVVYRLLLGPFEEGSLGVDGHLG